MLLVRFFFQRRYAAAGATRHARLLKIELWWRKWVTNPHFWGDFGLFLPSEIRKRRMFPRAQHWPLFKTPFALWCLPLAPYTQAREKHIRQELAGFWRLGL
jgi:hypothetical protein